MVVVGKFLTKRRINLEAVMRTLKPIRKTTNCFEVQDAGDNTVLFVFMNEEDVNKVLWSNPWSFDKYLVVLHRLRVMESLCPHTRPSLFLGVNPRLANGEADQRYRGTHWWNYGGD